MDITDDTLHSTMRRVIRDGNAPDYVLDSQPMDKEAAAKLPPSLFADRVNRRYPIDSKASTWLSAAYFAKTAEDDGYSSATMKGLVEDTIKAAASKYGIRGDVDAAMEAIRRRPAEKKAADDDSNYGWPSEKKYPMFDERGVKLANSYFAENCFNYPPKMRKEIATRIFQKCAEYGLEANDTVRREAGQGFNLRDDVAAELLDRTKAASHSSPALAASLSKAASALMKLPMAQYKSSMPKFAELLDSVDEEMGFADQYGVRFRSPMEIFHGRSVKEANDFMDDTVQLGNNLFSITKLAGLPMDLFTDALGDGFGDMIRGGSGKAVRITKKTPGGMMRITISGSMPEFEDGGFGLDTDSPKCIGGSCDDEEWSDDREGDECGYGAPLPEDHPRNKDYSDKDDEGDGSDVIDIKKLGKALKALPERDRNALRKAIEMYMD